MLEVTIHASAGRMSRTESIAMTIVDQRQTNFKNLNVCLDLAKARHLLTEFGFLYDIIHAGGNTQLCKFLFPDGKPDPSWILMKQQQTSPIKRKLEDNTDKKNNGLKTVPKRL
jgi:hypothetical protein